MLLEEAWLLHGILLSLLSAFRLNLYCCSSLTDTQLTAAAHAQNPTTPKAEAGGPSRTRAELSYPKAA